MESNKMADQSDRLKRHQNLPPRWAEFLIEQMLNGTDCQIIVGDLREEYAETIRPRFGKVRAMVWYVRQVLSFVPHCARDLPVSSTLLVMVSLFTGGCGGWLAFMEHRLHYPEYSVRIGVDSFIVLVSSISIVAVVLRLDRIRHYLSMTALALIAFALRAIIRDIHSNHFEGFVLIIALALMLQAALMLVSANKGKDKFEGKLSR
jgi:hypothetical protein